MNDTLKSRPGTRPTTACIHCNGKLKLVEDAAIKQEFHGEDLVVRSPAYVCRQCGRQYLKGAQGDRLRHNTAEAYRRRHNLLSFAQIENIRLGLKLSVKEFASQLQTTPKELRRWKKWLVQSKTTDQRIRRLFGPINLDADHFERFLTGHMSARRLCTETGLANYANELIQVLWALQSAYDQLVQQKANRLLLGAVRLFRAGKLTAKEVQEIFGLNANALKELLPPRNENTSWGSDFLLRLQMAEGGSWSAAELKRKFGIDPVDLCYRRFTRGIAFWKDAKGEFCYPRWQFTAKGALLPGIAEILAVFQSDDAWRIVRYFLVKRQQLGGRRPLDLIRAGEIEKVRAHAQLQFAENTW